jgi:hypothetical protein
VTDDKENNIAVNTYAAASHHLIGEPTPFTERLKFWNRRDADLALLFRMAWRPLVLLRFPPVLWSGFAYGASLVWYNVLNATASSLLSAPPYNFSASMVGLSYLGPLIGVCFS